MRKRRKQCRNNLPFNWWVILALAAICYALLTCCSCRSSKELTSNVVYKHTTDTLYKYRERVKLDSVYLHDSIFTLVKGDSIIVNKWRTQLIRHDVHLTDTIYKAKRDTSYIYKDRVKVTEVRRFSWWTFLIGVLSVVGAAVLVWLSEKRLG